MDEILFHELRMQGIEEFVFVLNEMIARLAVIAANDALGSKLTGRPLRSKF
jgi:hypothetical protein